MGGLCLPASFHEHERFKSPERFGVDIGVDIPITKQNYIKVDTQADGEKSTDRQPSRLRHTKNVLLHGGKFSKDPSWKKAEWVSQE